MQINSRNLAAALSVLGADVESALMELASVVPSLTVTVRKELYRHEEAPKLRLIGPRGHESYTLVTRSFPRWACAMHAADQLTRVIDDSELVAFLQARFSDYNVAILQEENR